MYQGLIHRYFDYLPVREDAIVSLLEGNTPLLRATHLEKKLSLESELYLKFEGLNPTGSFKDRGMTYAVSKAVEQGAKAIICASTGNTSASAAAYAAKAGIDCVVLIPHGNIAYGKLSQAMIHGAKVVQIKGNFDDALRMVVELARIYPINVVNSINPHRLQAQQTAAFEVCEVLDGAPDYHVLPVGNAGNITAYWMGYQKWYAEKKISHLPHMMGFQAEGAAPIVRGHIVPDPQTVATAIRIGNPASWQAALKARDDSGGAIRMISDENILEAYRLVASVEGYFCEPASAISIAGVMQLAKENIFQKGQRVVCTLTGHGLKDPDNAIKQATQPFVCEPRMEEIAKVLGF